jgi:hypothetical protein
VEASYQVSWLPDARKAAMELAKKANEAGVLDAFKNDLTDLDRRLTQKPEDVGELYRKKGSVIE